MTKREYYERLMKELKENFEAYSELKMEYDKMTQERQSGAYTIKHINEVIFPKQSKLMQEMRDVQQKAYSDVEKLTEDMRKYLRELDSLKPEEMTEDVKLLNSGIKLNKRDIQDIIDRNPDNRTMIQLAYRYAEEHDIKGLEGVRYVSSESQIDTFNAIKDATNTVIRWFEKPDGFNSMSTRILGVGSEVANFCEVME